MVRKLLALLVVLTLPATLSAQEPEAPEDALRLEVEQRLKADDSAGALALIRKAGKDVDVSLELFLVAKALHRAKPWKESLALLEEVVERFPAGRAVAKACLGLAETYRDLGDEARMVAAYRRLAELPAIDTTSHVMDGSNTKNRAHRALADHFTAKKDWVEALCWWTEWEPDSWCGNCQMAMDAERKKGVARCREEIARSDTAFKALGNRALDPTRSSPTVSIYWADLMIEKDRRVELEKRAAAVSLSPKPSPGVAALKAYLAMLAAAEKKDAAALWIYIAARPLPSPDSRDWQEIKARTLLLSIPVETKEFVRKKLATAEERELLHAAWILSALKDDGALPTFEKRLRETEDVRIARSLLYALLTMDSDPAVGAVRKLAGDKEFRHAEAAKRALERTGRE